MITKTIPHAHDTTQWLAYQFEAVAGLSLNKRITKVYHLESFKIFEYITNSSHPPGFRFLAWSFIDSRNLQPSLTEMGLVHLSGHYPAEKSYTLPCQPQHIGPIFVASQLPIFWRIMMFLFSGWLFLLLCMYWIRPFLFFIGLDTSNYTFAQSP